MTYSKRLFGLISAITIGLVIAVIPAVIAQAQGTTAGQGFSLQVTPSPLVATIKPGQQSVLELRIRNTNSEAQSLKMGLRSFSVDEASGQVNLGNGEPNEVKDFVSFSQPTFRLEAGAIMTQKVVVDTPKSAGFTYTFAITVARQDVARPQGGSAAIEGSVADFTLLSVDKPGAQRKFELGEFSTSKRVYEYLPASLDLRLKNTGNTLVQPKGNIFIQRKGDDANPIATLPVNQAAGYILPGSSRLLNSSWNDGFPRHETVTNSDGSSKQVLRWHWNDLSNFRFGRYTAKVVAIYDDGQRDVPITSEVTFWVIPWKIIGVFLLVILLLLVGVYTIFKRSARLVKQKTKLHSNETKKDS